MRGWTTYGKTLSTHDAEQQRLNTLLMTNSPCPRADGSRQALRRWSRR